MVSQRLAHFPTRRELVVAVYADEVTALCELGRSLATDQSPGDALFRWLRAFTEHVATKRELPLAIPDDDAGQRSALYREWHGTMTSVTMDVLHGNDRALAMIKGHWPAARTRRSRDCDTLRILLP